MNADDKGALMKHPLKQLSDAKGELETARNQIREAITVLTIANRNIGDRPMVSLAVAVALTSLGVPKAKVLRQAKSADRRKQLRNELTRRPK